MVRGFPKLFNHLTYSTILKKHTGPLMLQSHNTLKGATVCLFAYPQCPVSKYIKRDAAHSDCRLQTPYSVWRHLCIWPLSDNVWELSERRQTAYRWIHSFQGLLYLAQMFDCHSTCLCNLASHLKGSSINANKTNKHRICQWLMSRSHQRQKLQLVCPHFHLKKEKGLLQLLVSIS